MFVKDFKLCEILKLFINKFWTNSFAIKSGGHSQVKLIIGFTFRNFFDPSIASHIQPGFMEIICLVEAFS